MMYHHRRGARRRAGDLCGRRGVIRSDHHGHGPDRTLGAGVARAGGAPRVRSVETSFSYPYQGPDDWANLLACLAESPTRNSLVLNHVAAESRDGDVGLLLTGRVELAKAYAADLCILSARSVVV